MELLLIQSQEHKTLPLAELRAVLTTEKIATEIEVPTTGLVLLKSLKKANFFESYEKLVRRLAYTHEVDELILKTTIQDIEDDFKSIEWNDYISNDFAVRLKRFDKVNIDTTAIERRLGHLILLSNERDSNASNDNDNNKITVNLDNPESFIRVVATENEVFIGIERIKLNKKHFQDMKPHKRPFFYPGSMSPKLARCMVNLSHVKEGQLLLDPFCGTGGILIEGGMIGAKLIGSDIHWKMKNGTSINLDHCNIKDYQAHHIDVRELKLYEKVDAVVTDPPYGISTSTGGEKSGIIFHQFLESISNNMKENALLCIAAPHYLDFDSILNDLDFELLDRHEIKMHKSLTRIISVIGKIN
ncbi:23S rRNA m(2) methyltransferase [Methanobrevibacter cuticularis]|uniref:tRNA (guanine(10)-N(2))-dimethyltransferase n=1 Tax=Methanobrevibacter cuticularis TaxID=47311 RepID=A0A166E3U8_9EURY|nr:TIGR01177 family methyltransferase [Methanobrevibacter cuticularis]KZX16250.1 23S rRNA m(2) methyltransferase [Methanobrevibacter cuticularis]